jgi:hypothetical protein
MNTRITIALIFVGVVAIGPGALAEEKFQKLTGHQIQARLSGMELTDEVHWDDLYQPNGVLVTNEMGHKTTGKWRVQKISSASIVGESWAADATTSGLRVRTCS